MNEITAHDCGSDGAAADMLTNGMRVLLTTRCNYRCTFCHNEGMQKTERDRRKVSPELVADFVRAGVRDVTFSGGEPLLCLSQLARMIDTLEAVIDQEMRRELALTIVTNGLKLTKHVVSKLIRKRPSFQSLRVNCSVHTPHSELYDKITGTHGNLSTVRGNIRAAVDAGLDLRLNYVLLRDKNTSLASLKAILDDAVSLGVSDVKLIEFLVTEQNQDEYRDYFRIDPLIYNWRHNAVRHETIGHRTTRMALDNPPVTVHFKRCACAIGCRNCAASREIQLVPGPSVLGCIARSPLAIGAGEPALSVADRVARQIRGMAECFGDRSPSLTIVSPRAHAKASFLIEGSASAEALLYRNSARRFAKTKKTLFWQRPVNAGTETKVFMHLEPEEETHSVIACWHEEEATHKDMAWKRIDYWDPVYDFSRTKREANIRKLALMGLIPLETAHWEEDQFFLDPMCGGRVLPVLCRNRITQKMSESQWRLELLFVGQVSDPPKDILRMAKDLAAKHGLEIKPDYGAKTIARRKTDELDAFYADMRADVQQRFYAANDPAHRMDHVLRVIHTAFLVMELEQAAVDERALYLACLLHDMVRNKPGDHGRAGAAAAAQIMRAHNIRPALADVASQAIARHSHKFVGTGHNDIALVKLLRDADYLDCFGMPMIARACLFHGTAGDMERVVGHLCAKSLRAAWEDFHFNSARRLALPGWYDLRDFVVGVTGRNVDALPSSPMFMRQT